MVPGDQLDRTRSVEGTKAKRKVDSNQDSRFRATPVLMAVTDAVEQQNCLNNVWELGLGTWLCENPHVGLIFKYALYLKQVVIIII